MTAWIRYFACTDDSPVGMIALFYLKALCRIAPVRLVPLEVPVGPRWEPYVARLSMTATNGKFVNVVCAPRTSWAWMQSVAMSATEREPATTISGAVELYTSGVRNVLIAPTMPPDEPIWALHLETAMKYDAVVVPPGMRERWSALRDVHPMSATAIDVEALRSLIVG